MTGEALISIGDLAEATGLTVATLRAWETRYGFPDPTRLPSGHRRYDAAGVAAVLDVVRRRDAGVRLDVAIRQVAAGTGAGTGSEWRPSVTGRVGTLHPNRPRQRLRKRTLTRVCHAIEDEVVATAQGAHVFGGFQTGRHYAAARDRWRDLALVAATTHVFADFAEDEGAEPADGAAYLVPLPPLAPMLREWVLVCDAPQLPVALLATEVPGQRATTDRVFETVWSVDPTLVRDAARACAEVAAAAGSPTAHDLLGGPLAGPPAPDGPAPVTVERLVQRILGALDAT